MAMGHGFGSEWNLMRFLGRHRREFNSGVCEALRGAEGETIGTVDWLDFPYNEADDFRDGEWISVDFLPGHGGEDWRRFWPDPNAGTPNRIGRPSWDAVGVHTLPDSVEWLLVEAKAHIAEFTQGAACGAGGASRIQIAQSLEDTWGILQPNGPPWDEVEDAWMGNYYQVANRLAVLNFLVNRTAHRARLLFLYFVGDHHEGWDAPGHADVWREVIAAANQEHLQLPANHALSHLVHYLFFNVADGTYETGLAL